MTHYSHISNFGANIISDAKGGEESLKTKK